MVVPLFFVDRTVKCRLIGFISKTGQVLATAFMFVSSFDGFNSKTTANMFPLNRFAFLNLSNDFGGIKLVSMNNRSIFMI